MTVIKIAVFVCIVCAGSMLSSAATTSRKLLEARSYDRGWEADMGALDLLSKALHEESNSRGYIIIYGARRGHRKDVVRRMECMKNYVVQRRGIPAASFRVINGGYRAQVTIELWVAPNGSLRPKNVQFKRGGTRYTCNV